MVTMELDPVKYEILFNKLDQALNEAQGVVRLLSGSVIAKEAGETLEAFYLPSGEAVDLAAGILMHFLNITRIIHYMKANQYDAPGIGVYDGDHFMNNDAYIGGMHAPDTGLVTPFFYKGELLGYLAAISHTTETGGIEPGGMCPSATEAWHDGFHIPAVKIVERGEIRRDVWNMLLRSTRDPVTLELDLKARIAGNERARLRLTELVDEFGSDFFKAAAAEMVKDGEDYFRLKVKQLRPGIYSSRMYCDSLGGTQPPKLCVIHLDMEVREDGTIAFSLPVVSPQQPCFNNAYLPAVEATIAYCLLTQLVYETRWNSGMMNAVEIKVPEKSRLNADADQAVAFATVGIGFTLANAVVEALSRAFYASGMEEEVQAPATSGVVGVTMSGIHRSGEFYSQSLICHNLGFGSGARMNGDGVINYHFHNPWMYLTDIEADEMLTTALMLYSGIIPNSGGFGKFRGGSSKASLILFHKTPLVTPTSRGIGFKLVGTQGMFGGYPGHISSFYEITDTNFYQLVEEGKPLPLEFEDVVEIEKKVKGNFKKWENNIPAKRMKAGDIWGALCSTGGGLGDPIERDPRLIVEDIRNRRATLQVSEKVYAVAIDPKTLEVDWEETEQRRSARREERLSQGIPGREYIKRMVERRENRDLPEPAMELIDETASFSAAFQEQLETARELLGKDLRPLREVKAKKILFKLTPYVNIVEDEKGNKVAVCSKCGFAYCDAKEDYQLYALVYDRDLKEYLPPYLAPDKDWGIAREFYCPGCGTQVEVDQTPMGMPIIPHARIKGINY